MAPVLDRIRRDLWSSGRTAVNCSGLFYAGTSQNCNLRVYMHCFFSSWKENDLSSYSRCIFHIFSSVRHLYHTQLSPLALLVITCLLLSAVVILGGFLLVFWVVCFLLNHSNPSKIALLVFFPYPFFFGLVLGVFFECSIKSRTLCVTLPVRNFSFFLLLHSFDGTFFHVRFKNNII